VWAAGAVLFLAALLGGGAWGWWAQRRAAAQGEARAALRDATRLLEEEKWPEALGAIRPAQALLAGIRADPKLRQQVTDLARDIEMAGKLQEARLQRASSGKARCFDWEGTDRAFAEAFQCYGVDLDGMDPAEAAGRLGASSIRVQLAAALDGWAKVRRDLGLKGWDRLLMVSRALDPNPWRNRLRAAFEEKDTAALAQLAASALDEKVPPATVMLLSQLAYGTAAAEQALPALRQARQQHPDDFWLNHQLGGSLRHDPKSRHSEEAIRYLTAAVALRSRSPAAHNNLGEALWAKGRLDEAIAECREAIRLNQDFPAAHSNLGNVLKDKGQLDEAIAEYREAIRLKKDFPDAHSNLGAALRDKGRLDEGIAEYREAIRLQPDFALAHSNLGNALQDKGRLDEGIAEYREAIRLQPDLGLAHYNLGNALQDKGRLDEAIAEFREAIRCKKHDACAHCNLGGALADKGRLDEAIAEFRDALRLKKDFPVAHNNVGIALLRKGRLDEAIAEFREALRLLPDFALARTNLAIALKAKGRPEEAVAVYREAFLLNKDDPSAHHRLALALDNNGQLDEAITEYREAIRLNQAFPAAHNDLGNALANKGRLDEAIAAYREAIRLKKDFPDAHSNLGAALRDKGRLDEAIAEYREAIRLNQDFPAAHFNLGSALQARGHFAEAVAELKRGHELASHTPGWSGPSAQWVRDAERLVELDARLPQLLKGDSQPADAGERLTLAQFCQLHKKLYAASARWYGEAFAAQPALAEKLGVAGSRYDAACAAALAGCGQGKDADRLDDTERARLRRQALDWLRADLDAWGRLLDKEADKAGPAPGQTLQHWLEDPDFNGVRGPDALARLPEAERGDWQKVWQDVEALRQRAAGSPKEAGPAHP
jgi:tetratricopeptide (TPR) repeat protein